MMIPIANFTFFQPIMAPSTVRIAPDTITIRFCNNVHHPILGSGAPWFLLVSWTIGENSDKSISTPVALQVLSCAERKIINPILSRKNQAGPMTFPPKLK